MVGMEGLEPTRLSTAGFEPTASTIYTTSPKIYLLVADAKIVQNHLRHVDFTIAIPLLMGIVVVSAAVVIGVEVFLVTGSSLFCQLDQAVDGVLGKSVLRFHDGDYGRLVEDVKQSDGILQFVRTVPG